MQTLPVKMDLATAMDFDAVGHCIKRYWECSSYNLGPNVKIN